VGVAVEVEVVGGMGERVVVNGVVGIVYAIAAGIGVSERAGPVSVEVVGEFDVAAKAAAALSAATEAEVEVG
jgi:hypothetical protein